MITASATTPFTMALAGCGRLAREVLLPVLRSFPDVTVRAVADTDPAALEAAAALAPGATRCAEWRDLLSLEGVDAVIVALPTSLHAAAALAVMASGRALYLEKPIAASMDEGERLLAAHARTPVPVMVGFNYRFNPLVSALGDAVRNGAVGTPRILRGIFTTAAATAGSWRSRPETGGGVLLDLASHHVDLARYLLGADVHEVTAHVREVRDGCQQATVQLAFESGALASMACATGAVDDDRVEVTGDAGQIAIDRYRSVTPAVRGSAVPGRLHAVRHAVAALQRLGHLREKHGAPWHEPSYARALRAFVNGVRSGGTLIPGLDDGLAGLAIVSAALESSDTGRSVRPRLGGTPAARTAS